MKLRYPLTFLAGVLVGAALAWRPAPIKVDKGCVLTKLYENKNDTMLICGTFADGPHLNESK